MADQETQRVTPKPPSHGRTLDFAVIGAQRAATTSMWMYLRTHPELYLPPNKEIPFFARPERYERGFDWYLEEYFSLAPPDTLWGTSTPHYMLGHPGVPVESVVARMHDLVPEIKLIALLRDPIERAFSEYELTVYRELEARTFTEAMREQLAAGALERARVAPVKGTTYIAQGEYGRILELYLRRFPRKQLLLVATSELAERPIRTMRGVFEHLGVDPDHVPHNLGQVYHHGGTGRRVSRKAEQELKHHLEEHVWSRIPDALLARDAMWEFDFWFRHWNTLSEKSDSLQLEPAVRAALEEHFRADAERLRAATGFEPPWLEHWDREGPGTRTKGKAPRRRGAHGKAAGKRGKRGKRSPPRGERDR
jgi:sulfotransferase family protein